MRTSRWVLVAIVAFIVGVSVGAPAWTWVANRWTEFTVMRADIAYIHPQIEAARQQDRAKATAAPPAQATEKGKP